MAQSSSFRWEGRAWLARTRQAAARGVELGLEHVLAEAKKIVPLDEGPLERSGKVTVDQATLNGTITFDTPYAVRQHEDLSYKHLPGRQAKYLEQPMNQNREQVLAITAATIRRDSFLGGRVG
ncbi:minor capsid protein [Kitasatospora sp. McL0602]|uniref:minor capsid protein n=1 Tax=Kitasatospora sp. McL0602 TaxID=3439530 RepID=UPI003F8AE9DA